LAISHPLWLLAIDIYTKKCGYAYGPFWLLHIVHGYAYNPLAIVDWLLVLVIDIHTKAIVGMVITNSLLPIVHRLLLLAIDIYTRVIVGMVINNWLLSLAIDIYTRAIVGMVITNWLLPIVHGYVLNPLVISHHKLAMVIGYCLWAIGFLVY
jgi:hypothetical protein